MKRLALIAFAAMSVVSANAQRISNASFMTAKKKADVRVPFNFNDKGVKTPIEWGLDLAWRDEANVRTGVFYAGKDVIDIIRLSYQPTGSVEEGKFNSTQQRDLKYRADAVLKWCKKDVALNINLDNPSCDAWYTATNITSAERAKRWVKLIDMSIDYYKSRGLTNWASISPFNEPDLDNQSCVAASTRKEDFKQICKLFREGEEYKDKYAGVRMCGGNTLNTDQANPWWDYLKEYLDEGNTHQLAGNFDNFARFFTRVREYGHQATDDELHNVMEAMVGAEYGLMRGIWWGTCEKTRSDFMKATYHANPGDRLGYAEHRKNWTSASVYRHANGRVQAFGGTSERQAVTTGYTFVALDQPVWYDGVRGRDFFMNVKGGNGYQQGQINYEHSVDVQGGEDIMPHINGTYKIVNVKSGMVMGFNAMPSETGWVSIKQYPSAASNPAYQQWTVTPTTFAGDQAYYVFKLNTTGKPLYIDVLNWNYNAGADAGTFPGDINVLEQWYIEYAGNGAFYIRSRYSTKCLEVANGSTTQGANVNLAEFNGEEKQQWRFVGAEVTPDNTAPAAPTNLEAKAQSASVLLSWTAPADTDVKSYTVLRSEDGEKFVTLCNEITDTAFVDNEAIDGVTYKYKVYAEDHSLNRSEHTASVACGASMEKGCVMHVMLGDSTFYDRSENANHTALYGDLAFSTREDTVGLSLDGNKSIQLPYTVGSHDAITLSAWINRRSMTSGLRLFEFFGDDDHYMYLSGYEGSRPKFAIKCGDQEEIVRPETTVRTSYMKWQHIAFTLADGVGIIYLDGVEVARNENMTIKPTELNAIFNYIGNTSTSGALGFKGYVTDVRIYNYALDADEVVKVMGKEKSPEETIIEPAIAEKDADESVYDLSGRKLNGNNMRGVVIKGGKKIIGK